MSHHFRRYLLLIILLLPGWLVAGPLEDGHEAFDNQQYKKAYDLWLPLAQKNDPDALYNIGLLYMKGLGVEKNERTALSYFTRAGELGMVDAMYNAGVLFYTGKGVYPDYKSAIEWWQAAAYAGNANAQNNLAIMYAFAYGTGQNGKKALELWTEAAKQGHPDAIHSLVESYNGKIPGIKADEKKAAYWLAVEASLK